MSVQTAVTIAAVVVGVAAVFIAVWAFLYQRRMAHRLSGLVDQMSSTQAQIQGLSREMYALLTFSRAALSDDQLRTKFPELAQNYFAVFKDNKLFLKSFLDQHLSRTLKMSMDAAGGTLTILSMSLIDYAVDLLLLANPGDKVFATSYIKTPKFWGTPSAKRYLQEQERLVRERAVTVSRVFLYDDAAACEDARNIEEMDNHDSKGIKVYTAIAPELEADLRRDTFLIEDRLAAEYLMTADREELLKLQI